MNRCLYLAKKGLGKTYPNPMVGCVIVYDDQIIGEGWHHKAGEAHAEVNALASVSDKEKLKYSTLYVSLEPCSHFGKTPPCSDLIIKHQIPKVVIATTDNFDLVNGKGIQKLKNAGCQVELNFCKRAAQDINCRFFTFNKEKRPYIILKWAQTADRFIAPKKQQPGRRIKISDEFSHQLTHKWRTEEQAILIGKNTALQDEPSLTARKWKGNSPIKLIIDRKLQIPTDSPLFCDDIDAYIFTEKNNQQKNHPANLYTVNFKKAIIPQILKICYSLKIQSILVEGGAQTLQCFIDNLIWDEARIFTSHHKLTEGIKAPEIKGSIIKSKPLNNDNLVIFKNDQESII